MDEYILCENKERSRTRMRMRMSSCCSVAELEGTLVKDPDVFSYMLLLAFEGSGIHRFALLLALYPVVRILHWLHMPDAGLKLSLFVATVGVRLSVVESVGRAVVPKFLHDDINMEAWRVFRKQNQKKRVVVTMMPRLLVQRFVKEQLEANEVVGTELGITRCGYLTGFVKGEVGGDRKSLSPCVSHSKVKPRGELEVRPAPVIFHDGRLAKRPTPSTALLILMWIPVGVPLAFIRILIGALLPMWLSPYFNSGGGIVVRGNPPPSTAGLGAGGVLFVCTHRTLMDPVIVSFALKRRVPALTYSISRFSELLSPIPTVRLTRDRNVDAARIKLQLQRGDLVVCPEGTTCREPFLLRFSSLFAELTHRIVPVAVNYRVGFFHPTTASGWKALDPIFFFMNPRPVYEVTFLDELPLEATCFAGKTPHQVANYVQNILAATLGFQCTNFTRKDKYRLLAGNDGTVSMSVASTLSQQTARCLQAFQSLITQ